MNIALWIIAVGLAAFVLAAGIMKVSKPVDEIRKMPWAANLKALSIRLIGVAEIAGALGLILPQATGIAPILTPIASSCLAVLMAGASITHVRKKDPVSAVATTLVLTAVALFIAIARFANL